MAEYEDFQVDNDDNDKINQISIIPERGNLSITSESAITHDIVRDEEEDECFIE